MDDHVSRGEVEAHATGLEAHQEDVGLPLLEAAHQPLAGLLARLARELEVREVRLREPGGQEVEHARELREDQHLVAGVHRLRDQLQAGLELGAAVLVALYAQAWVAADLP